MATISRLLKIRGLCVITGIRGYGVGLSQESEAMGCGTTGIKGYGVATISRLLKIRGLVCRI